jgi:hypothetical protein
VCLLLGCGDGRGAHKCQWLNRSANGRRRFPEAAAVLMLSCDSCGRLVQPVDMQKVTDHVAVCLGALVLVLCASVSSAQPPNPLVGTWTLNVAKSKYPIPAPKSMTITIAPAAKGWTLSVDSVGPDGQAQKWGYTSTFDGSESPVSGNPSIDAAVFKSTEAGGTIQYKKGGNVVYTTSSTVSDDGKTLTVTATVPLAQGKEITIVSVYDKQ